MTKSQDSSTPWNDMAHTFNTSGRSSFIRTGADEKHIANHRLTMLNTGELERIQDRKSLKFDRSAINDFKDKVRGNCLCMNYVETTVKIFV